MNFGSAQREPVRVSGVCGPYRIWKSRRQDGRSLSCTNQALWHSVCDRRRRRICLPTPRPTNDIFFELALVCTAALSFDDNVAGSPTPTEVGPSIARLAHTQRAVFSSVSRRAQRETKASPDPQGTRARTRGPQTILVLHCLQVFQLCGHSLYVRGSARDLCQSHPSLQLLPSTAYFTLTLGQTSMSSVP